MMCVWLCLACHLWPTNHESVHGIRHIGERIMRGCASAVLRDCNMIELVHAKLNAATRRLSGMHVGRASVILSVFQFVRFVWASWRREGYWIPPTTFNSGRLHNLRYRVMAPPPRTPGRGSSDSLRMWFRGMTFQVDLTSWLDKLSLVNWL